MYFSKMLTGRNGRIIGKVNYSTKMPSSDSSSNESSRSESRRSGPMGGTYLGRSPRAAASRNCNQAAEIAEFRRRARPAPRTTPPGHSGHSSPWEQEPREHRSDISSSSSSLFSSRPCRPSRADTATSSSSRKPATEYDPSHADVVSRFLDTFGCSSDSDSDDKEYATDSCFVPSPYITFLIDRPALTCVICQATPLGLGDSSKKPSPADTMLLSCGHAFCRGCVASYYASLHASSSSGGCCRCPVCREEQVHAGCGHVAAPRVIARDTIVGMPKTTARRRGKKLGATCVDCRLASVEEKEDRIRKLAVKFKEARRAARRLGTQAAAETRDGILVRMERLGRDWQYDKVAAESAW